jgi:hypothetical protein
MFAWQCLPALFAPTLTSIALLCLINNTSKTMRVFGSGYRGFGLFCVSLDWSTISATGALYTPASDGILGNVNEAETYLHITVLGQSQHLRRPYAPVGHIGGANHAVLTFALGLGLLDLCFTATIFGTSKHFRIP